MEEKTRKIVLLSLGCLVVAGIVFFQFIKSGNDKQGWKDYINPAGLDQTVSKTQIHEQKRKQEYQQYQFDRKITRLESFLDNQIEKDPFEDSTFQENIPEKADAPEDEKQPEEKIVYIVQSPEQPKPVDNNNSQTYPARRKIGFASGGITEAEPEETQNPDQIKVLAVVHESAAIKTGSNLLLRTLQSFNIESITVTENTFLTGRVSFSVNHIYIDVTSVPADNRMVNTRLTAYDLNGAKGIYVEGGLEKEIKTDIMDQTVREIQKNVDVPILKNLPFNAAKKKIREPEVLIDAGHKIYLISQ